MDPAALSERLKNDREARGETIDTLARRIGVRREHLESIERGRFEDLPAGIYGRAAIRSFASACGLDPQEALSACEPVLRNVEEPIEGLARIRGLRGRPKAAEPRRMPEDPLEFPGWRPLAAAAIDAAVVVGLVLVVVVGAALCLVVPIAALDGSAPSLVLVGLVLGAGYFVWFGGLGGATLGERTLGLTAASGEPPILTLHDILVRTLRSATEDVRCIQRLGSLLGTVLATYRSPV